MQKRSGAEIGRAEMDAPKRRTLRHEKKIDFRGIIFEGFQKDGPLKPCQNLYLLNICWYKKTKTQAWTVQKIDFWGVHLGTPGGGEMQLVQPMKLAAIFAPNWPGRTMASIGHSDRSWLWRCKTSLKEVVFQRNTQLIVKESWHF